VLLNGDINVLVNHLRFEGSFLGKDLVILDGLEFCFHLSDGLKGFVDLALLHLVMAFLPLFLDFFLHPDSFIFFWHRVSRLALSELRDPLALVLDPLDNIVVVLRGLANGTFLLAFIEKLL
jgi:hypothetical protein